MLFCTTCVFNLVTHDIQEIRGVLIRDVTDYYELVPPNPTKIAPYLVSDVLGESCVISDKSYSIVKPHNRQHVMGLNAQVRVHL